jgi:hypothetical protein
VLIRVNGGRGGIAEYLRDGMKSDRDMHRDQLDKRICIDGDLSLTDAIIKDMAKTDKPENYLHITLSFAERDINEDKIRDVYEEYKHNFMAAYLPEEYNVYAEIHVPKIKSYQDKSTGDTVERFPHVHIVIPRRNLLDRKDLNPRGFYKSQEVFIQAIQEKINYDHELLSPLDNQRLFRVDESKILARYKGDNFKGANRELKSELFDVIQEKNISSMSAFKKELANYGDVSIGKAGKPDEYLKIKPHGSARNVRLTDACFHPDFIEHRLLKREKPTQKQVNRLVDEWVSERAHEVKYIHAGSPTLRKQYQSLPNEQKGAFLDEQRRAYYGRYDLSTGTRLSERASREGSHRLKRSQYLPSSRRTSDRELGASRIGSQDVANQSDRVSGLSQQHVDAARRQRRDGAAKLLSHHESHHLAGEQASRDPQLRRVGDEPRRRVKRFSFKRGIEKGLPPSLGESAKGLPQTSGLKVSASKRDPLKPSRARRIPARFIKPKRFNSNQTLFTVKRLKHDAQHSESYVTQLFESYQEHKHTQDELARFRDIRQHLKAEHLLEHLSGSHGLVQDHYRQFRAKDGSARIRAGKRAYNVSDFCTQHMGLDWEETKGILKQVYGQQRRQEVHALRQHQEQHAVNSIVFVSNRVTQGKARPSDALNESIRVLKHLQRQEHRGGQTMALTDLARFRKPETKDNAIHSANEDFSLTESAKRILRAREAAAQITLTMNDLVASKNEKKQFVEFLDKNTGDALFRDHGEKIVMLNRKPDMNHTAAALTLAAEKYGTVKITGNQAFKAQVLDVALSKDLNIVFADKAMEAEFIRRKAELKQAASMESAKVQANALSSEKSDGVKSTPQSASSDGAAATPTVVKEKEEPVTLVAHGQAPYQHKEENAQSYFVELSNGETKWGVKLKDAMEVSGAQIGDEVRVFKSGASEVEVQVQKEDEQGNKLPPETIEATRNEWVVEVKESVKRQSAAQQDNGQETLKPTTFKVDYSWDKLSGKTQVTINGESPARFDASVIERIAQKDAFLKHFAVKEIQFGLLDRQQSKEAQPVPKTYDAQARVVEENTQQPHAPKLK